MIRRYLPGAALLALVSLFKLPSAHAQLSLNFNPANQVGIPGGVLTFNATLINSGTSTLFLNGASVIGLGSGMTVDVSPFFNNSPLSLASGESWMGDVFTVLLDSGVTPGNYFGSFGVLGGIAASDQGPLADQNFQVGVSAPEPNAFGLLALGGLAGVALRRRKNSSAR